MGKSNTNNKSDKTGSYTEFYYHFFRNILLIGVPLVVISAIVLSSIHSSATGSGFSSGTDSLTISISSACTLGSVVDIEHNTNTNVGTYTSDIGKTTIKILCNDGNGYSVYAVGYSNNEEGNNKLINSERPEYSIDTGLATSGLTSQWAMKLSNIPDDPSPTPPTIESDYNNVYGITPPYWTKLASRASGTTDMAQGSSFTTTYAVYASSSQYAGTYNGQVKYLLTHPYSTDGHIYYMQEVDTWKNTLSMEQSVQAIDKRDGKKYWVTKLQDGNVWMTQNLDLDLNSYTNEHSQEVIEPLTSNDTDLINHSLTGAYLDGYSYDSNTNITTWTPAISAKTIDFSGTSISEWQDSNTIPYTANKTDDTNTGHTSLGNYYNMAAAFASNNTSAAIGADPINSICPKGWHLPTNSDFRMLNNLYNNSSNNSDAGLISQPLYFIYSGYIANKNLENINNGYYMGGNSLQNKTWTSNLFFSSNTVSTNDNKLWGSSGIPVRCLSR